MDISGGKVVAGCECGPGTFESIGAEEGISMQEAQQDERIVYCIYLYIHTYCIYEGNWLRVLL